MAGYSKESKRQNDALKSILDGGAPEKRVQVGYEGKKQASGDQISPLSDVMKKARMPWFCPKCDKIMKSRHDNKMWLSYGHCFNCQIEFENKLSVQGKLDEWKADKERKNKLAWIRDQKQSIEEFKKQDAPEFYQQFRPDGHSIDKEKWDIDKAAIIEKADEALEYLQSLEDSLT